MKNYRILVFIFLAIIGASCGKKDSAKSSDFQPLPKDTLVNILVDCQLAEAAILLKQNTQQHVGFYTEQYYKFVLKKHNITRKTLSENIRYYKDDSGTLDEIYNEVLNRLSRMQSEKEGKPSKKEQ